MSAVARSPRLPVGRGARPGPIAWQPEVHANMARGVADVVDAVRPTLGPRPRTVLVGRYPAGSGPPEILDHGATIGRRIYAVADRRSQAGASIVRDLMIRMDEAVGDGSTTAALLFDATFGYGRRAVAAGAEPGRLREHLVAGAEAVSDALAAVAREPSPDELRHATRACCLGDAELAEELGRAVELMGSDGRVEIWTDHGRGCRREWIPGYFWAGGLHDAAAVGLATGVTLTNAHVLVSDLALEAPHELARFLDRLSADVTDLVIVAAEVSPAALGVVARQTRIRAVVAKPPPLGDAMQHMAVLRDIALLLGARCLVQAAGQSLASADASHLGRARRVHVNADHLSLRGGGGDPRLVREEMARLAAEAESATRWPSGWRRERLARLNSGAVIVHVGGATEDEAEQRKLTAERALRGMRATVGSEVVPGAGAALLGCRAALQRHAARASELEERLACRALIAMCEAPARQLAENAGVDPALWLTRHDDNAAALDARCAAVDQASVLDPLAVVQTAARYAVQAAALCLTTQVAVQTGDGA